MYRHRITQKTNITRNVSTEGELIEQKVERIMVNKEPMDRDWETLCLYILQF